MSRAFVKEDDGEEPIARFGLPPVDDPSYDSAAALALLEAACQARTHEAERATGYRFGDPHLHEHVRVLLEKEEALPEETRNRRFLQMGRRFLRSR